MAEVKYIANKAEFDALLKGEAKAVIVDFTASWCPPCKRIAPVFQELANSHPNVIAVKVDVDQADDVAAAMGVSAMPTFMVFQNGEKVDSFTGANEDKLKAWFDKYN